MLLAIPGESTALAVVAMVLLGGGLILAVSLAFFAVGRSEDRERAAQDDERAGRFSSPRTPPDGTPPRRAATRRRDHD